MKTVQIKNSFLHVLAMFPGLPLFFCVQEAERHHFDNFFKLIINTFECNYELISKSYTLQSRVLSLL